MRKVLEEKSQILIGGDFMPGTRSEPFDPFSDNVKSLFQSAACTLVNLEAPLTERGKPILKTGMNFRIKPKYAEILKNAGVDCVCLANNHIRDFGDDGVSDTLRYCREAGLDFMGAGLNLGAAATPLVREVGGIKVAFLNYCEREFSIAGENHAGANPFDLIDAYRDITKLRSVVDRIIVIYHGGLEYQHYPTLEMRKNFRFLVDIGSDAVVAHHTHAYSGYESYKGKSLCYGLGNLLSYTTARTPRENWLSGLLAGFDTIHELMECSFIPISINKNMMQVNLSIGAEYDSIMWRVTQICEEVSSSKLSEYWDRQYKMITQKTLNDFSASSQIIRKVKRLLGITPARLGEYRTLIWLNSFRCSSHREKMEAILKQRYQGINEDK